VAWLFIVTGGHLLLIAAVVQSFTAFPVSAEPFAFLRAVEPHRWGAEIFSLGLWIALPMVGMLLLHQPRARRHFPGGAADEHLRDRLSDHASASAWSG
jgi:hypothetical protein